MNTGEKGLAAMVVPRVGQLLATGDPLDSYRLVAPDGTVVEAVSAFFAHLLAAGRSPATLRAAAGMLNAERSFRRVKGCKERPILVAALARHAQPVTLRCDTEHVA